MPQAGLSHDHTYQMTLQVKWLSMCRMAVMFIASEHGSGCPYQRSTEDGPWMEAGLAHLGLSRGGLQDTKCLICPGLLVVELGLIPASLLWAQGSGLLASSLLNALWNCSEFMLSSFLPGPVIQLSPRPSPGLLTLTL